MLAVEGGGNAARQFIPPPYFIPLGGAYSHPHLELPQRLQWPGKKGAESGGLSSLLEAVVQEMNHLGMLIDVSHLNEKGFWEYS